MQLEIIYKEYVVYTISFNESFETDFNMRDYRINSLYYDWKKRCILGFKESFEDVIYSKLVPCNEELIEKDSLKLIRGIRLSRKLELSLKVNYMKLFQMDLADINSNFIAIRLINEFFKNKLRILDEYGLVTKIVRKLEEFNILKDFN